MFKKLLITFAISMVPVLELRGAVPIGVTYGLPLKVIFPVCIIGNMIPVPFAILFTRNVLQFLESQGGAVGRLSTYYEEKLKAKSEKLYKYEVLGLILLVAIPLPGTGAWTGSFVASILDLRLKTAVPAIFAGVVIAGIIMSVVSYGAFAALRTLF